MLLLRPSSRPRPPRLRLFPLLPLLLPLLLGKTHGALPEDLIWEIYPKQVALGETISISYQLDKSAPPFTLAIDVNRVRLEVMEFDETPVYGMTMHKMNATGRHEVALTLKWGPGKGATLKGDVWVYIPLKPSHVSLSLTNVTRTPPGDVTMTLNLTSDGELPTLVTGTITWGQGQASKEIDFSEQTAPGSLRNMSEIIKYSYPSAGFFPVEVVLGNPISSITLKSQASGDDGGDCGDDGCKGW
ncbi:uncharacterized protein LOC127008802 [Eriocheir sinensis]|uniref:uncharacterized protein LOC127008802 n=1 Tax=Eriocheir sinensis TaxID=95602 RepID=UPI0021CA1723|nr:uncharacterized protein LOC127008802 [Eriocheir sinensis]